MGILHVIMYTKMKINYYATSLCIYYFNFIIILEYISSYLNSMAFDYHMYVWYTHTP